jgi:ABC-2 type transport system ATP-binding protein
MIEIEGLNVSFGEHLVLDDLSTSFASGNVHGVVGLNGSGKTTLFNAMASYLRPNKGKLKFLGMDLHFSDVALLETNPYFFPEITGREYLSVFKKNNERFKLEVWTDILHLPLDELVSNYSTGMKRKLALLGLLKLDRPIYILDEPFNGLDLESNKIVEIMIGQLRTSGKTILLSSHILSPMLHVCDSIQFLENGSIRRTFNQSEFATIEGEVFGNFEEQVRKDIRSAM